jgi:D-lactate dehydrogenase
MRIAMFSTKPYDRRSFETANSGHDIVYLEPRLARETAALAAGAQAVCVFVNDDVSAPVLQALHSGGTRVVLLRCAGFNNVDLKEAERLGIAVARVPAYSPHAVAEFTIGLLLSLVRGIHRAHQRTREGNFALEGLLGFDLHGRTAGVIGTGKICTAPGSLDNSLSYAAHLKVCSCQAARIASGLRWPFFSISHSAL